MTDTILIADDHSLFRTGLKNLVSQLFEKPDVLEAANYDEAMAVIKARAQISLVLLDLRMPQMDAFSTLGNLVQEADGIPVIVLSGSSDISDMKHCFERGVMGYLPKSESPLVIQRAIQLVMSGGIYVPPEFLKPAGKVNDSETGALAELTGRQREVLNLLAEGQSNKEIARSLDLSEATVKAHLAVILRILKAKNRTQAVVFLQKWSLTENDIS